MKETGPCVNRYEILIGKAPPFEPPEPSEPPSGETSYTSDETAVRALNIESGGYIGLGSPPPGTELNIVDETEAAPLLIYNDAGNLLHTINPGEEYPFTNGVQVQGVQVQGVQVQGVQARESEYSYTNGVRIQGVNTSDGVIQARESVSQFLTITGPNGHRILLPLQTLQYDTSDGLDNRKCFSITLTSNQAASLQSDITAGKGRLGL